MNRLAERTVRMEQTLVLGRGDLPFLLVISILAAVSAWAALGIRHEEGNESMTSAVQAERRVQDYFPIDFGSDEVILIDLTHPHLLDPAELELLAEPTSWISVLSASCYPSS